MFKRSSPPKWLVVILPWSIWFLAILFFIHQYFLRLSISGLSPKLISLFHLNMVQLSDISNAFFYTFIVMQLLGGFLIDRFGARMMLTFGSLCLAAGCFIFANSPDLHQLEFSRSLMGVGAPIGIIASVKLIDSWFKKEYFQILTGITIAVGSIGAFLGEGLLSVWIQNVNWRHLVILAGFAALILALLIFLIVRNFPKSSAIEMQKKEKVALILSNVIHQSGKKEIWLIILSFSLLQVPMYSFFSLWAIHFIMVRFSESAEHASLISASFFIFYAIGVTFFSLFFNKIKYKISCMVMATVLVMIVYVFIIYYTQMSESLLMVLIAVLGILLGVAAFSYSFLKELSDDNSIATMTALMIVMSIVLATFQNNMIALLIDHKHSVIATILNLAGYSLHVYERGLGIILFDLLLAIVLLSLLGRHRKKSKL